MSAMSTATANMHRSMPPKQQQQRPSEASKVYDPVKTAEGMFNGCVSRIALALKDPKNYGEYTPYIIAESSKLFQDALDDLTIQVLDVKWLLEEKLAQNRAKRESERKAKESASAAASTPGKRKHDAVEESPETPSKRPKTADPSPKPTVPVQNGQLKASVDQPQRKPTPQPETITIDDPEPEKPTVVEDVKQSKPDPPQHSDQTFDTDDFGRPSAQATPAMTEDVNDMFDLSMFPTNDQNNETSSVNGGDDGMNFEFDNAFIQDTVQPEVATNDTNNNTNNAPTQPQSQDQADNQTSSLGSMLPGLEQYANMQGQSDDLNSGLGISQNNNSNNASNDSQFNYGSGPNMFDEYLGGDSVNMGDGGDFVVGDVELQQELDLDDLFGFE